MIAISLQLASVPTIQGLRLYEKLPSLAGIPSFSLPCQRMASVPSDPDLITRLSLSLSLSSKTLLSSLNAASWRQSLRIVWMCCLHACFLVIITAVGVHGIHVMAQCMLSSHCHSQLYTIPYTPYPIPYTLYSLHPIPYTLHAVLHS